MAEFKNLALTGELVAAMPQDQRWFEILEEPKYEEVQSFNDPNKKVEKLLLHIKLSNGNVYDYFVNNRSARIIARTIGTDMTKWIGTKWNWKVLKQLVAGNEKDCLYIQDIKKL